MVRFFGSPGSSRTRPPCVSCPSRTWGGTDGIRIFAVEPAEHYQNPVPEKPEGDRFAEARARQREADMAPPAKEQRIDRRATHGA